MNKKSIEVLLIFLIIFVGNNLLEAQQRFYAGLMAGFTASQIDGDDSAGFNKPGLTAGVKASAFLNDKMDLSFEILFSQRGSQTELVPDNSIAQRKVSLSYVEVPVIFGYNDWYEEEGDFYHLKFLAGFSYGRLIDYKIEDLVFPQGVIDRFNENNVSWLLGATYFMNEHWGFSLRYNSAITFLFDNREDGAPNHKPLVSRFLNLQAIYMF